jgi:hypothetical protein
VAMTSDRLFVTRAKFGLLSCTGRECHGVDGLQKLLRGDICSSMQNLAADSVMARTLCNYGNH